MRHNLLRSFVLSKGGPYRGTWRNQYHVVRITTIANHGGFHTKTSLAAGEALDTKSTNGPSSNTIKGWPNKCFMITSSKPGITASQAGKLLEATQS